MLHTILMVTYHTGFLGKINDIHNKIAKCQEAVDFIH